MKLALVGAALVLGLGGASVAHGGGVAEPPDYRTDQYRAAVPETLAGAKVIDTEEAATLWRAKAATFIDVLPRPPRPKLPEGAIYKEKPRSNIPGSIWLPNTGFGALTPESEDYFQEGLAAASKGNKNASLVIYCLADCWMSWNAAKRAVSYGYAAVLWYPRGTDGWIEAGLPVEMSEPMPGVEP